MSTSQKTMDQVKSILGKLDRNIDAARAKRMQDRPAPTNGVALTNTSAPGPLSATPAPIPVSSTTIPATAPVNPNRSQYGRATPMRLIRPQPLNNTGT